MICLWTTWFLLKKKGTRSFLSLSLLFPAITCLRVWISIHNLIINSSRATWRKGFSNYRRTRMCRRIRKRQMNTKFNLQSKTRIQSRTISKNSVLTISPQQTWINTMTLALMTQKRSLWRLITRKSKAWVAWRWKSPIVSFESSKKISSTRIKSRKVILH